MPSAGGVSSFLSVIIWGTIVITIVTIIAIIIRNKVKYQYSGVIYKRRQENLQTGLPESVIIEGKAGYFVKKKRKTVFRIKWGKMPWQQVELTKLPDPKYMVGNKVYYVQLNKDNYVQCKAEIDWEGAFKLEPVEDDLKYGAELDMAEKGVILDTKSTWDRAAPFVAMGIFLVVGIIVFYFNSKACG